MKITITDTINVQDCEIIDNTDLLKCVVVEITDETGTYYFCARESDPYCGDRAKKILSDFNSGQLLDKGREIVGIKMCEIHGLNPADVIPDILV